MTRRDRTDPEGEYRRESYGLNEQQDDVFCAGEGYAVKAYGPHYKNGEYAFGSYSSKDPSVKPYPIKTITDLVHEVIVQREKIGQATYGRPLLAGDGRDTLQDAIEEAADLLQYLVKLKTERDTECP